MMLMPEATRRGWLWGTKSGIALIVALVTLIIDQANKWWMLEVLRIGEKGLVRVTPFLDFVYVQNKGISYGLFSMDSQEGQFLLAGLSIVATMALWVWLARDGGSRLMAISLGLIMGGAVGNAIDRVLLGGVADFFKFHALGRSWYVFNIADAAIVAGVVGLLYDLVIASRKGAANP